MHPTWPTPRVARRSRLLRRLKALSRAALRRRGIWISAGLALAVALILAAVVASSPTQAISPVTIIQPKQGAIVGLEQLRSGADLPVIFLAPESSDYATLSLRRQSGISDLTTVAPFTLTPGGAGGLIESVVPLSGGGQTLLRVSMFVPVPPDTYDDVRLTVGVHGGGSSASATVDFTLDLIPPTIYESHSTRTDESDQDLLLNRVCVEVNESIARIELACNGAWLGPVPAGEPERVTVKERHAVFCLHSQPVPSDCTGLMARVTDWGGNVSAPYDYGDFVCSIPAKQLSEGGRRNALVVDTDDRLHAAYILENGVYYATQGPDGAWQTEPIHCACGFNMDTKQCRSNDCNKRYGLNVGLAVDDEGTPGVCFVYGDVFDPNLLSEYTAVGEVHVRWRQGAEPGGEWPGELLGQGEARFFHCAIANPGLFGDQDYPGATVIYDEGRPYDAASVLVSQIQAGGSTWKREQIAGFLGREVSAVQDADGRVHIVFRGSQDTGHPEEAFRLNYARHGRGATGSTWRTAPVEDGQGRPIYGSRPSLALGPQGRLGMSYADAYAMIQAYAARRLFVDSFSGTETWDSEAVLRTDPFFGQYTLGLYAQALNPGGLATQDRVYVGAGSSLALDSGGNPQVVFVAEKRQKPGTEEVVDLGELIAASRDGNGRWLYSVLDGRVEGSVDLSAALNSAGRLRVLFHNGLHPPGQGDDGARGSLQYWHAESRSAVYANPDDAIGAALPPELDSCAAHAHLHQDDSATRLTEPQINLLPGPARLVANPANPSDADLADLLERIRRYVDVSDAPFPPTGYTSWDTADMTQPDVRDDVAENLPLRYLLQELARFVDNLGTPGGFAVRLRAPHPAVPGDPVPAPPASLQQEVVAGSLVEDIFTGLRIRSNNYSPVVKQQVNVCVPDDCLLRPALTAPTLPATTTLPTALFATAVGVQRFLLKQSADFCQQAGLILVVGVNGQAQTACYGCPFSWQRVIGMPGVGVPVCAPACADNAEPDYRRIDDSPYITCLEEGCDDTRCPAEKCPAPPSGTPAQPVREDEVWRPVPGRALCVRCPEGATRVACTDEGSTKCGDDYACATGVGRDECERAERACKSDADCDVAAAFGCVTPPGTCRKLPLCESDSDCDWFDFGATCANGLCRAPCTKDWQCPKLMVCTGRNESGFPPIEGACTYTNTLKFDPADLPCQSAGCSTCLDNAYCLDSAQTAGEPDCLSSRRCIFCPAGHTCATQQAMTAPVCLLRPLADDYFLELIQSLPGQDSSVLTVPARFGAALGGLDVKTEVSGHKIEFSETVQRGGLRLRPHPLGPEHQGYIVLAIEFPRDLEVGSDCNSSITIPKPVMRIRFQPYSFNGRIYAASIDMGVYPSIDATEPIEITADHLDFEAGCAYTCGCLTDAHLAQVNLQLAAMLSGKLNDSLLEVLNGSLDALLRNMIVGGWMFGREQAIDELDVARDTVPGASLRWTGDANPTDEIERLVIRDPDPSQPGWGRLDYVER